VLKSKEPKPSSSITTHKPLKKLNPVPSSKTTPLKPRKKGDGKLSTLEDSHPGSLNSSTVGTKVNLSFAGALNSSLQTESHKRLTKIECPLMNSVVMQLESQLTERLAAVKPTDVMNTDKFRVYQTIFEEVISRDHCFGSLLTKIKSAYEDWLSAEGLQTLTDRLKAELSEKNQELAWTQQEASHLGKKVSRLAKENAELGKALDDSEAKYSDLQDRVLKLTQAKCDSVPRDEVSWKYMVLENKHYAELLKTLKRDNRQLKQTEDKLLKLMLALKKQGIPVEQVYKEECRKMKEAKLPYKEIPGSNAGDEDAEPFVHGPPKAVKRPQGVPMLTLAEVGQDSSSEESGSYTDSAASSAIEQTSQLVVPKLTFTKKQAQGGFQQEFMSKFAEFSDSWRKQIEKEQKSV
jgi:hypothetical protein